ncbi:hypothetical protein [Candidatus Electrothrix sp.]|uniref:hypothetical protein n=1 Tax=Candidatus Electrothrix sp. TaxID=2170559 RepID=UPI004055AA91
MPIKMRLLPHCQGVVKHGRSYQIIIFQKTYYCFLPEAELVSCHQCQGMHGLHSAGGDSGFIHLRSRGENFFMEQEEHERTQQTVQ